MYLKCCTFPLNYLPHVDWDTFECHKASQQLSRALCAANTPPQKSEIEIVQI